MKKCSLLPMIAMIVLTLAGGAVADGPPAIQTHPIEVGWDFSGHRSRSDAEKTELARQALDREADRLIGEWNKAPFGVRMEKDSVKLDEIVGGWSRTKKSPFGKRTHSCGGTAKGTLYFRVFQK